MNPGLAYKNSPTFVDIISVSGKFFTGKMTTLNVLVVVISISGCIQLFVSHVSPKHFVAVSGRKFSVNQIKREQRKGQLNAQPNLEHRFLRVTARIRVNLQVKSQVTQ